MVTETKERIVFIGRGKASVFLDSLYPDVHLCIPVVSQHHLDLLVQFTLLSPDPAINLPKHLKTR